MSNWHLCLLLIAQKFITTGHAHSGVGEVGQERGGHLKIDQEEKHELIYIDDNLDVRREFGQRLDVERGLVNLERRQKSRTLEQAEEATIGKSNDLEWLHFGGKKQPVGLTNHLEELKQQVRRSKREVAEARSHFRQVENTYNGNGYDTYRSVDDTYSNVENTYDNVDNNYNDGYGSYNNVDDSYNDGYDTYRNVDDFTYDTDVEYVSGDDLYDTSVEDDGDTYGDDAYDTSGDFSGDDF